MTKSGLMAGLGEGVNDIEETLCDLHDAGVDIITIGQYIQPSNSTFLLQSIIHWKSLRN